MKSFIFSFVILFACAITANAGLRASYEDEVIVQRSELIVVAHLKENSIQYVPHPNTPEEDKEWIRMEHASRPNETNLTPQPMSWEHHATLVITEIIKGISSGEEIPIIIHYGLEPVIGGYVKRDGFMMDVRGGKNDYPTNLVQIFDTGDSIIGSEPVVADASKDNIWFLRRPSEISRRPSSIYQRERGTNDLGIVDPEDVQPLQLKEYFETYLSQNPEDAVKSYVAAHPEVAGRAERYLNHLEVQRILKIEDPASRFDVLLPHYLNHESWDMNSEIRNGIISCGSVAGEKLVSIFNDPAHADFRENIILIWRDMEYTNVAPLLIQLLKDDDKFWAEQKLTNNWWNTDVGSELTQKRRVNEGEVYYSVAALRTFHDPRAKDAIELTKKRWEAINFDNQQILEECNAALKELGNQQ